MTEDTLESTRQAIIDRLNRIRDDYELCLSDVSAEVGMNGAEWSMVDLLRHTTGDYMRNMVNRLLAEDNPVMGGGFDMEAGWRRVRDSGGVRSVLRAIYLVWSARSTWYGSAMSRNLTGRS